MKRIIVSIHPKWLAKILNGEKTVEIRKTAPSCDLPCVLELYCTRGEELFQFENGRYGTRKDLGEGDVRQMANCRQDGLNGRVVGRALLVGKEKAWPFFHWCEDVEKATQVSRREVLEYMDKNDDRLVTAKKQGEVKLWLLSKAEAYPEPRDLSQYGIAKAPQSWAYLEETYGE